MKTVLLAWELGGGMGHIVTLWRLAKRLRQRDLRLVAAVKNPDAGRLLCSQGIEIVRAPAWPSASMSPAQIARTSSATMGEVLATAGLADGQGLCRLLSEWDDLFLRIKPNLVVGHLAPAASLVARGRVPLMLVGDGYALPPAELKRFPRLHSMSHPGNENLTLAVLNTVLQSRRQAQLDYLPQIFSSDARMVVTFPLLDPYAAHRVEPLDGPILDYVPVASDPKARSIFVYLSRGYALHRDIPDSLLAHAQGLRIHAPALSAEQARDLTRAGAVVDHDPIAPAQALAPASLVIHLGGSGLAAEALMAGIPQLVLSMQVEQWLNGSALQRAGLGRVIRAYDPASTRISHEIDSLLEDTVIARKAVDAGRLHRDLSRRADVLAKFEHACRGLLGSD
jgi:UDP:flavonoid glycosyltransferase YjiC (YdhE family)